MTFTIIIKGGSKMNKWCLTKNDGKNTTSDNLVTIKLKLLGEFQRFMGTLNRFEWVLVLSGKNYGGVNKQTEASNTYIVIN